MAGEEKTPGAEKAEKPREAPKPKVEAVDASDHPWVRSLRSTYSEERAKNLAVRGVSAKEWTDLAAFVAGETTVASQEIRKVEEERNQAILHGDAATLDRLTSDDYTFITVRGELRTKAEILQGFRSGSFHYDSRTISDLKIRTYGTSAVVTGRATQTGRENGKDYSGDYWFTRVYVKRGERWVTVALQTTLIQP